jgi:hypothetical protein
VLGEEHPDTRESKGNCASIYRDPYTENRADTSGKTLLL